MFLKKLFILFTLLSTFILADILGFELNKPISDMSKVEKVNVKEKVGGSVYSIKKVKFFDAGQLELDSNENIMGISFVKTYSIDIHNLAVKKVEIVEDIDSLLKKIETKYGVFSKEKASNYYRPIAGAKSSTYWMGELNDKWINKTPNDPSVGQIVVALIKAKDKGNIPLSRPTKVNLYLGYINSSTKKQLEEKKDKELEGF